MAHFQSYEPIRSFAIMTDYRDAAAIYPSHPTGSFYPREIRPVLVGTNQLEFASLQLPFYPEIRPSGICKLQQARGDQAGWSL